MTGPIPREIVTPSDYSPIVSIITWILLGTMILGICLRITINAFMAQKCKGDDRILILTLFLGIGQSVAVTVQSENGIGRHRGSLVASQVDVYQKACYASNLLYIATLAISKILVLSQLRQITPVLLHRRLTLAVGVFISMWTVASLLASAFQCRVPKPWMILGAHCFNQISFWISYGVLNIITEIALIVIPIHAIWNVNLRLGRKLVVIGCFASRLVVIGAVVAQLSQLEQLRRSKDATFDYWRYSLSTQIVQCSSVITVCATSIKNFITSLDSGMIQTGQFQLRSTPTPSGSSSASPSTNRQPSSTVAKRHNGTINFDQFTELNEHSLVSRNIAVVEFGDDVAHSDDVSRSSEAQTIKKTTEWRVDYGTRV